MPAPSPEHGLVSSQPIGPAEHARPGGRSKLTRARLAVEISIAYALARRALRRAPIETAVAQLRAKAPPAQPTSRETLVEARSLGWIVARTLVFMPGDTRCLARSLVLTRLLAQRGISARLVIGARTSPEFLAHAWVEHGGEPVLDPGDGSFARLTEL